MSVMNGAPHIKYPSGGCQFMQIVQTQYSITHAGDAYCYAFLNQSFTYDKTLHGIWVNSQG